MAGLSFCDETRRHRKVAAFFRKGLDKTAFILYNGVYMIHNGFFAKGIHKTMDFYNVFQAVDWRVSPADAPHARIYLLRGGSATIPLTDGLLSMQAGHAYLLPAHLILSEARGTDAVYDLIRLAPNVLTEHLVLLAGCAREIPLSPTIAPLAEACERECVMPLPSPMMYNPS